MMPGFPSWEDFNKWIEDAKENEKDNSAVYEEKSEFFSCWGGWRVTANNFSDHTWSAIAEDESDWLFTTKDLDLYKEVLDEYLVDFISEVFNSLPDEKLLPLMTEEQKEEFKRLRKQQMVLKI